MKENNFPELGSVIIFKNAFGNLKAWICISVRTGAKPPYFYFMCLAFEGREIPSLADIQECNFYGSGNMLNPLEPWSESSLTQVWTLHPEVKPCHVGAYGLMVSKKDWKAIAANFQVIGRLNLFPNLELHGNGSMLVSTFDFVQQFFDGSENQVLAGRGQKQYKLAAVVSVTNA